MTPFALLESLAGLSHREAGEFHGVRIDTVKSWATGRNNCPPGPLGELRALIAMQERAACETLAIIKRGGAAEIELGYPSDDREARSLGWPCVGAWAAMAARIVAATELAARLVPRGSTSATAAAIDARGEEKGNG